MKILDRIKKLCNEKNISVGDLEKVLELSNGSIYKWNKTIPGADKVEKVADYFDVSTDYLLGRTEFRKPEDMIDILEDIPLDLLKHYQEQGMSEEEMIESYTAFRKAEKEDVSYEQENNEIPENIRAVARDLMDLPEKNRNLAIDMIKMMSQRGKEAKEK